ncbi:MAG: BNR repeat-containing protein [Myxococcota bacterium]|nr:BNR repeat-containing protein [Myxococcota bacterium]
MRNGSYHHHGSIGRRCGNAAVLCMLVAIAACGSGKLRTGPIEPSAEASSSMSGGSAVGGSASDGGVVATDAESRADTSATSTDDAANEGSAGTGATPTDGGARDGANGSGADADASGREDGGLDGAREAGGAPALVKSGESLLTDAGLSTVSYGAYINGESFQEDGVVTYNGYEYTAFWNANRHVVLARRALPAGAWSSFELADYANTVDDAHNTVSLGVCPADGTLHLAFDHHSSNLHYRVSVPGLVTHPAPTPWSASSFSAVTGSLVGGAPVTQLTYPRFVTEPDGTKMLFEARIGASGNGDQYLWEYDGATHAWTLLGRYVNGTANSVNAYAHGLSYTKGGTRLHMAWCWRDTPDPSTNHDLLYIYSDDHGRTWKNDADAVVAVTGSSWVTTISSGIHAWTIRPGRGLINSEHMAVDSAGLVHVLLSHMPDSQGDDLNFDSARTKSLFFHYWKSPRGTWTRTPMGLPVVASFRGKLAIVSTGDVYAILPDLRIAAASKASSFSNWTVLSTGDSGRFFSDPLVDTARLASEDKLTIVYPQRAASNIFVLDYVLK